MQLILIFLQEIHLKEIFQMERTNVKAGSIISTSNFAFLSDRFFVSTCQ